MKTNIYTLELKGGLYYVGSTKNPQRRIAEHFEGKGSSFTKRYRPEHVHSLERDVSVFLEDARTLELMYEFGINNVRGGSYPNDVLTSGQVDEITSKISWATGRCSLCSSTEHMMRDCLDYRSRNSSLAEVDPICIMNARMLILNGERSLISFKSTIFTGVDFTDLSSEAIEICNVDLTGSDFSRCNLSNVVFTGCILRRVVFKHCIEAKEIEGCTR